MVLNKSNLQITRGKNLNECSLKDRCETLAFTSRKFSYSSHYISIVMINKLDEKCRATAG